MLDHSLSPAQDAGLSVSPSLVSAAKEYAKNARATATTKAYAGDWTRFLTWCASVGLSPLPCEATTLALYLTHRAEQGRKPSVLEREMAAISVAHRLAGLTLPRQDPLVREVISGIRRTKKVAPKQAPPLFPADLKIMSAHLPESLAGKRDRAILLVGFAGAFRVSELSALLISDIVFGADGITINLRTSKTDQEGRGRAVGVPFGSDPLLCPVRALKTWLAESHLQTGWLFRQVGRGDNLQIRRLGGQAIALMVKARAKEAGLSIGSCSGHSLRAGLATSAARAGKSMTAIQRQTGHKSLAMVARYVRDGTLFQDNAASGIGL